MLMVCSFRFGGFDRLPIAASLHLPDRLRNGGGANVVFVRKAVDQLDDLLVGMVGTRGLGKAFARRGIVDARKRLLDRDWRWLPWLSIVLRIGRVLGHECLLVARRTALTTV
jgi:hypothetical protein